MGVTITAQYQDAPSFDMSYTSFNLLREKIANCVSDEFGMHYAHCISFTDVEAYDRETFLLIKKYKIPLRIMDFLFASDCAGKLSPFKCKAVYDLLASSKIDVTQEYGYTAYHYSMRLNIAKFMNMLLECYNTGTYLIWY